MFLLVYKVHEVEQRVASPKGFILSERRPRETKSPKYMRQLFYRDVLLFIDNLTEKGSSYEKSTQGPPVGH